MKGLHRCDHQRRRFLATASGWGMATLLSFKAGAAAEPAPEITKLRFIHTPSICIAPQYVADAFLRMEGFTEIEYVKFDAALTQTLVNSADLATVGAPGLVASIDAGLPISVLAGLHVGCWELFGQDWVPSVRHLNGRSIAIAAHGSLEHVWLSSILAYVGLDPRRDVQWVTSGSMSQSPHLFVERKAEAFLGFPPQPQEMRARKIGHVLINTTLDRPWSQYFCCMVAAKRQFVQAYPVATKRALRALLKAADLCAQAPEQAARYIADKGYEPRFDVGLEVIGGLPYQWRKYDAEDTVRFHALRLHEVGMISSSPQKIIAQGTDWRFLDALRGELKA